MRDTRAKLPPLSLDTALPLCPSSHLRFLNARARRVTSPVTPAIDCYTFAQPLSALYSDDPAVDKLRANLYATTEKLSSQLIALRNTIPVADDSDACNYVHEIVVRAQVHVNDFQSILGIFTDRKVKEHKKTREQKARERAELKRKAQDSQEAKKKRKKTLQ